MIEKTRVENRDGIARDDSRESLRSREWLLFQAKNTEILTGGKGSAKKHRLKGRLKRIYEIS